MSDTVLVAAISSFGAVVVGLTPVLSKLIGRKVDAAATRISELSTREQRSNSVLLERIESKLDEVGASVTDHLSWHLHQPTVTNVNVHPKEAA